MGRQCEVSGKKTSFGNHVTTRGKAKYLGGVGTKCTGISRRSSSRISRHPRLAAQRTDQPRPGRHLGHPQRQAHPGSRRQGPQTFPLIKASKGQRKARASTQESLPDLMRLENRRVSPQSTQRTQRESQREKKINQAL